MLGGVVAICLAGLAAAQGLDDRMALQDALLDEAAHGDLDGAVAVYQRLSRDLPDQEPLRGDALFWLGHAQRLRGDLDASREALREGIRSGLCPTRCRDLLEEVEIEVARVTALPVSWTFDEGTDHGLFHPWRFQDRGALRVADGHLSWTTESGAPGPPDRLVMAFDQVGRVSSVSLAVRAIDREARLQVVVSDRRLVQFGLREALRLPADQSVVARLRPEDFVPVDGPGEVLDPANMSELWLVDITSAAGPVTIAVEQLTIR